MLVTLTGRPPTQVNAIIARLIGDAPAILRTAAHLATSYGVELVVESGPRLPGGVTSMIRELRDHGLVVREEPVESDSQGALVVAGDTSAGAHVVIRTDADPRRPTAAQVIRG